MIPSSRPPRSVIQQNRPHGSEPEFVCLPLWCPWTKSDVPPDWYVLSVYSHGAEEKTVVAPWGHLSRHCWLYKRRLLAVHGILVSCSPITSNPSSSVVSISPLISSPFFPSSTPFVLLLPTRNNPSSSVLVQRGSPEGRIFSPDPFALLDGT